MGIATAEMLRWLEAAARRELAGCRVAAHDGTVLFTPDGVGSYGALWTRDYSYMVENAGDLLDPHEVRAAIVYLLRGQRADGCIPDRVQADGRPVYSAGAPDAPLGEPPTDNGQFMVNLVHDAVRLTGDLELAREHLHALRRGLEYIPRSERGLAYIAPGERRSPYGFTDTVAKTGELLFSSLLDWDACRKMADSMRALRRGGLALSPARRADRRGAGGAVGRGRWRLPGGHGGLPPGGYLGQRLCRICRLRRGPAAGAAAGVPPRPLRRLRLSRAGAPPAAWGVLG